MLLEPLMRVDEGKRPNIMHLESMTSAKNYIVTHSNDYHLFLAIILYVDLARENCHACTIIYSLPHFYPTPQSRVMSP
jgi:hypothetical protein